MYQLHTRIFVPASLPEVWDFFSSPQNLSKITTPSMGFKIKTGGEGKMYPGQIIAYTVKPVAGIPMEWVTEITHVEEMKFFVDEQRKGPYKMWHHEHHFKSVDGGVEMEDIVSYLLPLGFLGNIAHVIFVKKQLESIFNYRTKVVKKIFPGSTNDA
jgi:ligand-binding SRPBCC domain-containing protein